jgi:hypothetical protein
MDYLADLQLYPIICENFCAPRQNTITEFYALVNGSRPSPPVKHTCEESFYPGSEIRRRSLRRVLYRSSAFDLNREVLSHYDCTISCHRWVRRAPLGLRSCALHPARLPRSDSRRVRRTGDNSCQHGMDGDCIDEDNCK